MPNRYRITRATFSAATTSIDFSSPKVLSSNPLASKITCPRASFVPLKRFLRTLERPFHVDGYPRFARQAKERQYFEIFVTASIHLLDLSGSLLPPLGDTLQLHFLHLKSSSHRENSCRYYLQYLCVNHPPYIAAAKTNLIRGMLTSVEL